MLEAKKLIWQMILGVDFWGFGGLEGKSKIKM
jgi:hypothetical protein